MGKSPKNEIMTAQQMDEMNLEILNNNRLYDKDISNSEKISVTVGEISKQLMDAGKRKISLRDSETVRAVTEEYLKSCMRSGLIPSKMGLARALGVTRASVDSFIKRNPNSETAQFLQLAYDAFAEMLSINSLSGSVHPIVSIFLQKALYGFRENTEQPEYSEPPEELPTPEEIAERYAYLLQVEEQ